MELALGLGDAPTRKSPCMAGKQAGKTGMGLGFYMELGVSLGGREGLEENKGIKKKRFADSPLQPDLLPFVNLVASMGGFDANRAPSAERVSSRASDDDDEEEFGLARKKLRLSKEQSAFLEKSFKEHTTLNPKQKEALAMELNLQPRQVQVWFQNRRARKKLKQTEMECQNLKRCCEKLAEANRRLQWELAHLRALKAAHPLYTKLQGTTLSKCPSCKRVTS